MNVFRPWECNSSGKPSSVAALHPLPIHQPQISADITIQHQHLMTSLHDLRSCKHHNMRLIMSHYLLQVNQIEQCRSYDLLMSESHQQTSRINWFYNQQRLELVSRTLPYLHSCTPAEPIMNPVHQHRLYNSPGASRRTLSKATVNVLENWYFKNFNNPYPNDQQVQQLATDVGISSSQVKKWMANKRIRSHNTLKYNGSVHPKRLQRLQRPRPNLS